MAIRYAVYDTALGDVTILSDEKALVGMKFGAVDPLGAINEENAVLYDAIIELNQYCFGQRKAFDVRLRPEGTDFERKVWDYVRTIPYGKVLTYEDVAKAIGEPRGERSVGMALNRNPIPLFIPCHRVIGKGGSLVGYIGGLDLKRKLLAMEKTNANRTFVAGEYKDDD
ncbi:MAG: methylated-DNA--[protein]-cysteine S-methyltransferase [Bacilli bacterium]|nr:methylated-DNA--[protein]-cysteine S-methyltransferase [Bacilli bacterium]